MRALGRLLQLLALAILPLAMFLELSDTLGRDVGVSDMLIMLIFGFGLFYVGRLLEGLPKAS